VLDVATPAELAGAIARDDKALIGRANGVGPKLAQRIVTELKDKPISDGPAIFAPNTAAPRAAAPSATGEAVSALMGLGVAEPMARRVIEQASLRLGEDADVSALIKAGLQELGR
jgi:Holliday junction DNA helicase RuvA